MWWRDSKIVKGTGSIWSLFLTFFAFIAFLWLVVMFIFDTSLGLAVRLAIAIGGTIILLVTPGGLACIFWLTSSEYRKQHWLYRRGGSPPGYAPGAPWQTSPVGKHLKEFTDFYLSKNTILGSHPDDFQRQLKEYMYGTAAKIYAAENPLLACRHHLAGHVSIYADWAVLGLKPEYKLAFEKDDPRSSPYVSGELHDHLRYCAQYNSALADVLSRNKDVKDDDLFSWVNARSCEYQYLMKCINMMRADFDDVDLAAEDDWFRPFVKSMLICREDDYRSKIGLPPPLPNELVERHRSFFTYVLAGDRNTLSRWESEHRLKHSDVS
jgi:hypothetical protein